MKVKIVKCTNSRAWYLSRIGEEFDVDNKWHDDRFYRHISKGGWEWVIRKSDCIELTEKEQPNLQVSLKIQPNGKTVVAECTHISDELRGKGTLAEKDGYKVKSLNSIALSEDILYVRGEDKERDYIIFSYNFDTPEQAQQYVKVMNELIDEINNPKTDWNKVEVGTKVIRKAHAVIDGVTTNDIIYLTKLIFKEYIPQTNQIIVFNDNKVEVYDASEVKLCEKIF